MMANNWKSSNGGGGVNRVLNKLKTSIENGKYYEAHQMYRTLYFRYIAQRKFDEVLELMHDGARTLLQHKQNSSGADLANLYVEVLIKSDALVTEDTLEKLGGLYELIHPDGPERATFVSSALKWSSGHFYENRLGHPRLHQLVAQVLWKEKNYSQAWCHYLRSMDGEGCASMLVEYHMLKGCDSEVDLFIAQAVLQLLCLQNKPTATIVFCRYTGQHPSIGKGPPFFLPLLNFLWFLLLTVESGKLTTFTVLCEQYQPSIQRDPTYSEYLDKIGQLFFGLPPPKPKPQGMFGNFLQSLLSGLDDDDEEMGTSSMLAGPSGSLQAEELD